jgi:hypothetical protein
LTVIALASLAVWLLVTRATGRWIRPRRVTPAPATPELGTEPPAVVNLLVNRGVLTGDAARATLIDLAARRIVQLYQPTDDPLRPLVRVRVQQPAGLLAHEERVLAQLRQAGPDGRYVPLAYLASQYARDGREWQEGFVKEVREAAAKAGLTNSFFTMVTAVWLGVGGVVAGLLAMLPLVAFTPPAPPPGAPPGKAPWWGIPSMFCLWVIIILALGLYLMQAHDRDGLTDAGRRVTAQWLGVAGWLRAHPELAKLPAASVEVWDRYLSYGVALGVNPAAARAVDLRIGQQETVWVIRGDGWNQVTVAPPKPMGRTGIPAGVTVGWTPLIWPLWLWLAYFGWQLWQQAAQVTGHLLVGLLLVAALGMAVRAPVRLVRALLDLLRPVTVAGTVLSMTPVSYRDSVRSAPAPGERRSSWRERWLYVVLDDGSSSRLRPWRIGQSRMPGVQIGDRVLLRGQRFGRYARQAWRIA